MGRRAKYFTSAERLEARRAQSSKYAQSDKGKARRKAQRQAGQNEGDNDPPRTGPPSMSRVPSFHLPALLISHTQHPFFLSYNFYMDNGPNLGLLHPPYEFIMPSSEELEVLLGSATPNSLAVKLHTLQFRNTIEGGTARRGEWLANGEKEFIEVTEREINQRMHGWAQLEVLNVEGEVEETAREVALQWSARLAFLLAEELELRCRGIEQYRVAVGRSELPWQLMCTAAHKFHASLAA